MKASNRRTGARPKRARERAQPPARSPEQGREHVEDLLDEALKQTFPASDPVTLKACGSGQGRASAGADPVPHGTGPNDGYAGEAPQEPKPPEPLPHEPRPPAPAAGH